LPEHGCELADDLLSLIQLHGSETIAAVIVEPIAGAGGVILPPKGYLERLREICTEYGILLIFDEVITGFGRLGASCAAERFNVVPDMITTAKGITNATIPMGAVLVSDAIYQLFMERSRPGVELFHGYTYSGHPVACAAAMATLDIYEYEELFDRGRLLDTLWMDEAMKLRADPRVIDIRGMGLIAAIELAPRKGEPMARGPEISRRCYEKGCWVRNVGDTLVLSPPLIIREEEIATLFGTIAEAMSETP
jgi:beta-alanine--pyruvate transaminase